jgi:hypothetical protein
MLHQKRATDKQQCQGESTLKLKNEMETNRQFRKQETRGCFFVSGWQVFVIQAAFTTPALFLPEWGCAVEREVFSIYSICLSSGLNARTSAFLCGYCISIHVTNDLSGEASSGFCLPIDSHLLASG